MACLDCTSFTAGLTPRPLSWLQSKPEILSRSGPLDSQRPLEVCGKLYHRLADPGGLLNERIGHALQSLRFAPHQLHSRHDQRQVIVDVVSHGGELLVKLFNFRTGQCRGFGR